MEFARAQLSKYGWQEGKGLGKDEDGITQAIKPKLKFDNSGIGYNGAEQFTYFWWQHAFNSASDNIGVSKNEDGISMKASQEFDISTKKLTSKRKKNLIFNNFLKSASTLTNSGIISTATIEDEKETTELESGTNRMEVPLTDEELFQACGGRTAHKGARHGCQLSGKLARIEEQEQKLLLMMTKSYYSKQEKQEGIKSNFQNEDLAEAQTSETCRMNMPKKYKKKKSRYVEEIDGNIPVMVKKKRKKNRSEVADIILDSEIVGSIDICESKNKEKKTLENYTTLNNMVYGNTIKKLKMKKKKVPSPLEIEMEHSTLDVCDISAETHQQKAMYEDDIDYNMTVIAKKKHKKNKSLSVETELDLEIVESIHTCESKNKEEKVLENGTVLNDPLLDNKSRKLKKKKEKMFLFTRSGGPTKFYSHM